MTEQENWKKFIEEFCTNYLAGLDDYRILIKAMYNNGYNSVVTPDKQLTLPNDFTDKLSNVKAEIFKHIAEKDCIKNKYQSQFNKLVSSQKGKSQALLEILKAEFTEWKTRQETKSEITKNLHPQEIIKEAVKELNYRVQINKFIDFLDLPDHNQVGAFLIHGQLKYGQRWLINRLCFEVPQFTNALVVPPLPLKRYRHHINPLWQELGKPFGINDQSAQPQDIIQSICQHWQTQTIIICFSHFNYPEICGQYLKYLISNFWQPLVETTRQYTSQYSLLLFLLDETKCTTNNLGIPIIRDFDVNVPWNICELDELSCFKNEHLNRWLGKHENMFEPIKIKPLETIFSEIMQYNQKTPEDVLDKVCSYFNLTWNDIETTLPIQIKER